MYIPDLPTYLVFYLKTTHGSSIDTPPTTTTRTTTTKTPTHLKSFYIPDKLIGALPLTMCHNIVTFRILGVGGGWVQYWGAGGGWVDWKKVGTLHGLRIHRDVNPPQAMLSDVHT